MTIRDLVYRISVDSSGLKSGERDATSSLNNIGDSAKGTSAATGGLTDKLGGLKSAIVASGIIAGAIALGKAIYGCVQDFSEAELASKRLSAVVQMQGIKDGTERISELADEIQNLTGVDGDLVTQLAAQTLAQGKTIDQTEELIKAAANLSAITGDDLATSLRQLNNTYSGMAGTIGKTIPEVKDLTAEQLAAGDAIDIINEKYGGFAETMQNTTDVALKRAKEGFGDFKEIIGSAFAPAVIAAANAFTDAIKGVNVVLDYMANHGFDRAFVELFEAITGVKGATTLAEEALASENARLEEANVAAKEHARAVAAQEQAVKDYSSQLDKLTDAELQNLRATLLALAARTAGTAAAAQYEQKLIAVSAELSERQKAAAKEVAEARKNAEAEYQKSLDKTDLRVKLGIITEQEAVEAKKKANADLIDALIELGYTGAETSKQIGDQTLREAIARSKEIVELAKDEGEAGADAAETTRAAWQISLESVTAQFKTWADFGKQIATDLSSAFGSTLTALGESLATGGDAWKNMGKVALESLADILYSIGLQLTGLAAVKAVALDWVGAGVATAGAAAAFVGSGLIDGWASKYARGSDFTRAGLSMVNEEGPEMINLPAGASVTPATRTPVGGSTGGGNTFIINSPVAVTPSEAARQFTGMTRRLAFEGVL